MMQSLADALKNHVIKGAALDVFEDEPNVNPDLLNLDNVTLTPHIASLTMKARLGMCREALGRNYRGFLKVRNRIMW